MKHLATLAIAMSVYSVAWNVSAQDKDSDYRKGPLIGFALGVGSVNCNGCDARNGPALDWHVGWLVSKRLALMLNRTLVWDSHAVYATPSRQRDDIDESLTVYMVAAQYWLTDRVWVKGGIGMANSWTTPCFSASCGTTHTYSDTSLGLAAVAGGEIMRTRKKGLAMDLQVSFQTSSHRVPETERMRFNTFLGQIGFNWYHRHHPHTESDAGQRPTDGGPS